MRPQRRPINSLMTIRIIWAALIMGVVTFGVIVLFFTPQMITKPDPQQSQLYLKIAIAMLCVSAPLGFIIKGLIWRSARKVNGSLPIGAYSTGKIVQMAMLEGVAFFALVATMLNGGRGPHLIVAAIAVALMLLSFPTGGAMQDDSIQPIHKYDS
jgi:hypothetical protein